MTYDLWKKTMENFKSFEKMKRLFIYQLSAKKPIVHGDDKIRWNDKTKWNFFTDRNDIDNSRDIGPNYAMRNDRNLAECERWIPMYFEHDKLGWQKVLWGIWEEGAERGKERVRGVELGSGAKYESICQELTEGSSQIFVAFFFIPF